VAEPFSTAEADERLRTALRALPPGQRAAVVLRHWLDLSSEDAADVLGCSAQTVRSQAHRGLAKLRLAYGAQPTGEHHG
jgi:RNA polymerase sigma factor (sigma-70 family)